MRYHESAFSLIETTTAIGIFVFAIVGILSLIAASDQANRAASEESVVASILQKVQESARAKGLQELVDNTAYKDADADFFFDNYGNEIAAIGASAGRISYQCTVVYLPATSGSTSLGRAVLKVEYPFSAPSASRRSVCMPMGLASYE